MAENADVLIEVDLLDDQELNIIPLGPPGVTPPVTATAFSLNATIGPTSLNFYAQIGNEVVLVTVGQ